MSENIIKYNARVTQKRDTEANWNNAVNFIPLRGEIIVYEIDNTHATPRFKVGDGVTTIVNLPFSDNTISGTVTKEIGGISKNTVYTDASIAEVLTDLLFPYVAFTFTGISTTESAGTLEYGTTRTISKVTPSFTLGSKPITSVKVGTTSGGSDLFSGTTATNGTAITLTTSKQFNGESGGTIYCTISDGENAVTKSAKVDYKYYNYAGLTTSTTIPTSVSGEIVNRGTSAEIELKTKDNSYIWFLMPDQNKDQIQQYAMNQWNNMDTIYAGTATFTTSTGKQVLYHAYRSNKMVATADEIKYRIN